jgi:hypothetical protein
VLLFFRPRKRRHRWRSVGHGFFQGMHRGAKRPVSAGNKGQFERRAARRQSASCLYSEVLLQTLEGSPAS